MFRSCKDRFTNATVISRNEEVDCDDTCTKCDLCTEEYASDTELEYHRRRAHKTKLLSILATRSACRICVRKFHDEDSLIRHMKSEHLLSSEDAQRVEREIYICDHCNQIYFNKGYLSVHILKQHYRSVGGKFECPRCCKMVKLNYIWGHFQNHMMLSASCCPICLDKCKNRADLKEHLKIHTKQYSCERCGYLTKNKDYFEQHLKQHETDTTAEHTVYYRRLFVPKSNSTLVKHRVRTLRGVSIYGSMKICILCRAICVSKKAMQSHVSFHMLQEVKKRYVCSCGEEFFNRVLLNQHVFKSKDGHFVLKESKSETS